MKCLSGLEISSTLTETATQLASRLLIIYDMQVGIVRQIKDADLITAKLGQLLKAARAANVRTFFTRHMSLPLQIRLDFPSFQRWLRSPVKRFSTRSTMSAFERTPDLGLVPVLIADACGSGNVEARQRSLESLAIEGNTLITDVATFTSLIAHAAG